MKPTTLGAVLWLCCLQYFAAEAIAVAGWRGSYSFRHNFISDLGAAHCQIGAVCSPAHPLMNASFLLQGVLILGGALLVWPLLPRGPIGRLGLTLVGASGLGVFVVGLAPEDVSPSWHYLGAVENFMFCNAGAALLGAALLSRKRTIGAISLAAGLTGLFGLACLGAGAYFGLGVGGMERVTAYPFPLWIAAMGAWLIGSPSTAAREKGLTPPP